MIGCHPLWWRCQPEQALTSTAVEHGSCVPSQLILAKFLASTMLRLRVCIPPMPLPSPISSPSSSLFLDPQRYSNNGQTRKSGGYSVSTDGGKSFTKPNYPNNKIVDTATAILIGRPSGEGDLSMVVRGNYYYLFFQNVEDWRIFTKKKRRHYINLSLFL